MATPPDVLAERARTVAGHAHVLEEGWKWKGAVAALRAHLGDDSKIQAALTTIIKKQNCGVNGEYTVGRATPLLTACVMGNTGDATMLLEFGANPTHVGAVWDRFHHRAVHPLGAAAREGRAEIVKILLAHKDVDVNQASESGTALSLACAANQMDVVKMLLEADGIVLIGGGVTTVTLPAVPAAAASTPAAAINSPPKKEITAPSPFQVACCYNRIEIVTMLMETDGVDVNDEAALRSVLSPLAIACQQGYFELVKLLLTNSRVDVNRGSSDPFGMTPLCFACQRKDNMVMIKMLLAHSKIFVNGSPHKKEDFPAWASNLPPTPLVIACNNNDANLVELLLAQDNIDVNKLAKLIWERGGFSRCSCDKISPLFLASGNGNEKIVRLLLQADGITLHHNGRWPGAWSKHHDPFGYGGDSPVYIACCNGHIEVVRLLLKATGYHVDHHLDQFDETLPPEALLVACRRNDTNLIQLLLEHGVDPNARDDVIDVWDYQWNERLAEEVRDAGMAPIENEEDSDYDEREVSDFNWGANFPLHYAAEHGNLRAVQLLLVYGADPETINHLGNIPRKQAELTGNGDVATFFNATKDWELVEVAAACRLYGVIVRQVRNDKLYEFDRSSIFAKAHAKPDELPWPNAAPINNITIKLVKGSFNTWHHTRNWMFHGCARVAVWSVLIVARRLQERVSRTETNGEEEEKNIKIEGEIGELGDGEKKAKVQANESSKEKQVEVSLPVLPPELWLLVMGFFQMSWWKVSNTFRRGLTKEERKLLKIV